MPDATGFDPEEEEPLPRRTRIRWGLTVGILAVLVSCGIALVSARSYLADRYYVATDAEGTITVYNGMDASFFGRSLSSTYQHACLNEAGQLQLVTASCAGDYLPFSPEDLPETDRPALNNIDPGSFDEVSTALSRLAERALPACRPGTTSQRGTTSESTFRAQPGVNCRQVVSS